MIETHEQSRIGILFMKYRYISDKTRDNKGTGHVFRHIKALLRWCLELKFQGRFLNTQAANTFPKANPKLEHQSDNPKFLGKYNISMEVIHIRVTLMHSHVQNRK